jgi:hypothetical protein
MTRQEGTMSYRPKEDGSYVTSDSEGRGRRAGGLNPEQRRIGARNGIEVRKQRRHRRCSGALLLINLVLPLSQVAAETDAPGRRPTRSGAHVLACRSPELFVAQAWEFTRSGIVNSGDCVQFEDTPSSVEENRYRIQTSNDEYVCIQTVIQPQCFWTKAATLQHLGQGPQLSEAQFSEVTRLHREASKLSRMEHSHIWEAEKSAKEAEAALDPLTRNRLLEERDRLYKLATDLEREAAALRSQAANIRP